MKAAPAWDVGKPRESNRMRRRCTSMRAIEGPQRRTSWIGAMHCVARNQTMPSRASRGPQKTRGVFLGCPRMPHPYEVEGCGAGVTEREPEAWHSGPAFGPLRPRKPAAVTHAGYAYCQLRDTELSVQFRHGHGPRATRPYGQAHRHRGGRMSC